jgi:hypothetical protein
MAHPLARPPIDLSLSSPHTSDPIRRVVQITLLLLVSPAVVVVLIVGCILIAAQFVSAQAKRLVSLGAQTASRERPAAPGQSPAWLMDRGSR